MGELRLHSFNAIPHLANRSFAPIDKDDKETMEFEFSPKVKDLQKRLAAFMEEHIYPNEAKYQEHCDGPNRWRPVPVIEELKPKARAAGLWNLFLAGERTRRRVDESGICSTVRDHGALAAWVRKFSTARRRIRETWKCWSVTGRRS